MKFRVCELLFLCCCVAPSSAWAYEIEIDLDPDQLATPIVLPSGVTMDNVSFELVHSEMYALDPTPQPALRSFHVAGFPISIYPEVQPSPLNVWSARVSGRDVVLLNANRYVSEGRIKSVKVRMVVNTNDPNWLPPVPSDWTPSLPSPDPVLVIVTTDYIVENSELFDRYVHWRQASGFEVIVGTEQDWDQPVEVGRDRRQQRIRQWLRSVRDTHRLGYVLLIGDPDRTVPMLETHPMSALVPYLPSYLVEALDPVPTDHYYADLEGDWDLDGDGRFGEYPDDLGSDGIRWDGDAVVGRIPVYGSDTDSLDVILQAIMDYETEADPSYRRRVLLPAAYIGFQNSPNPVGSTYEETIDGAIASEFFYKVADELDEEAQIFRFYEEDGLITSEFEHELPLDVDTLLEQWMLGAGIFVGVAHGSTQGMYRLVWREDSNGDEIPGAYELDADPYITSWHTSVLAEAGRAFTFHAACENGWPEDPDNLAYSLLRNGAIATVGASRAAIGSGSDFRPDPSYGDADTLAYAYVHLLLEGMTVGEAVAYLRYGVSAEGWGTEHGIPLNGYGWLGKMEFNLYGDPTVSLGRCVNDEECSDGSLCNGAGRCVEGYCVQGELVDCSHLDGDCEVGQCVAETGECIVASVDNGSSCDDGMFCTENDRCEEGICLGETRECGEAPEGFVSVCDEENERCEVEPETSGEGDGGPDGDGSAETPMQVSGGGCSSATGSHRSHLFSIISLFSFT